MRRPRTRRNTAAEVEIWSNFIMASTHAEWDTLSNQFAEAAERAGKTVVAVHGGGRLAASGIIWRAGIVVSASHMLRRTEEITLLMPDMREISATFAGRDPGTDLAILKTEAKSAAVSIETAPSSALRVGQWVLGVGRSSLGDLAASAGIIARLGSAWRTWRGGHLDRLIRPDITLYPGQSGSALVDSSGHFLGMNTSALARGAAITVPTATIDRVINEILAHGHVFRPYLGVAMQPVELPEALITELKLNRIGLMVMNVEPASPSAQAGIMLGDIITGVNGREITGVEHLQMALRELKRGDSLQLTYVRGGKLATASVKVADRPRS
jgi:S1-C subfamily serine protease